MLTISKPLSAGQATRYHAEEFRNARENYYTTGEEIRGQWHGQLAESGDSPATWTRPTFNGWPKAIIPSPTRPW